MAKKTMDKGEDAKGHLAEGEKRTYLFCGLLVVLGLIIWLDYGFLGKNANGAFPQVSSHLLVTGVLLGMSRLAVSQYFKRMALFCFLALLISSLVLIAIGFHYIVGVRAEIDATLQAKSLIIVFLGAGLIIFLGALVQQVGQFLAYQSAKQSKKSEIDFAANKHALNAVCSIGVLACFIGWLAYNYLPNAKDMFVSQDGSRITLTMIVLFSAGIATFLWAAKSNFIKSVQTDEMIAAGKRDEMKNTAQLIADSSAMLSKSDPEKSAGLAFLNQVASDKNGLFSREAYEVILDFCDADKDISPTNKLRTRALGYASKILQEVYENRRYRNEPKLAIEGSKQNFYQRTAFFQIVTKYRRCRIFLAEIYNADFECEDVSIVASKIKNSRISGKVAFQWCRIIDMNVRDFSPTIEGNPRFKRCNFSGCCLLSIDESELTKENFVGCYYYADDPPSDNVLRTLEGLIKKRPASQRVMSKMPGAQ